MSTTESHRDEGSGQQRKELGLQLLLRVRKMGIVEQRSEGVGLMF